MMNQINKKKETLIRDFNGNIFSLIKILRDKFPKNDNIRLLRENLFLAQSTYASIIIENAGAYLYKYKAQIKARDLEYFKTNSIIKNEKIENPLALELIQLIMTNLAMVNKTEEDEIYKKLLDALNQYIEYRLII